MKLEIDIKPTEDIAKLTEAVHKIFPDAHLTHAGGKLTGETDGKEFEQLVNEEQIAAAISKEGEIGYVDLSKMAAMAGRVALDESFPLGKIRLFLK